MTMEEPKRIGLTAATAAKLADLLAELNPAQGETGSKLINIDLYRLAIALGLKEAVQPPPLTDNSNRSLRVGEVDPEQVLYTVLQSIEQVPADVPIYSFMERLAEQGINGFYAAYQQRGQLPLEQYFNTDPDSQ